MPGNSQYLEWEFEKLKKKAENFVSGEVNPLTGGITFSAGGQVVASSNFAVKNLKLGNCQRFVSKLRSASTTGIPASVARIGDSTTLGAGAGTSSNGSSTGCSGAWAGAPMQLLQESIQSGGKVVSTNNFWCCNGNSDTTSYSNYDSRVTLGANWGFSGSVPSMGGTVAKYTTGSINNLSVQMSGAVSEIAVYYLTVPDLGAFDVLVNGQVVGSGTCNAALGFNALNVSISSVVDPVVSIRPSGAASVYIAAIEGSGNGDLVLRQFANFGSPISDLVGTTDPWSSLLALDVYQNDLTIINVTINDANAETAKNAYRANLEKLIQKALKYGDVWLELGAISDAVQSTNGALYNIQDAVVSLAEAYDLPLISFPAIMKSFAIADDQSLMFDTKHPTLEGYSAERDVIYSAISSFF